MDLLASFHMWDFTAAGSTHTFYYWLYRLFPYSSALGFFFFFFQGREEQNHILSKEVCN